jgi:hypothetical protein
MGYFVAYRHTGADPERLSMLLPAVCESLRERGEEVYCTYFDEDKFRSSGKTQRQIIEHAFAKINGLGGLFVVLDSNEKSEGMLMEIGYCLANNLNIVVAKKRDLGSTHVPDMANHTFEYDDIRDLKESILTSGEI